MKNSFTLFLSLIRGSVGLALLIASPRLFAAQQANPLFEQAGALAAELAGLDMNDVAKKAWAARFAGLQETQQALWAQAGQVDAGACKDACADMYDANVLSWQAALESFVHDAQRTLTAFKNDPDAMFKCWNRCDRDMETAWKKCNDGPIDESPACHDRARDAQIACVNGCQ